jgi:uncharacterized membrane protein YkvA (DUF1232 family)
VCDGFALGVSSAKQSSFWERNQSQQDYFAATSVRSIRCKNPAVARGSHTCANSVFLSLYRCQQKEMAMQKRLFGQTFVNWYRKLIRHSKYRWVVLLGTLLYFVSPIDISPDVFPVIGWIDDGLVATIAITEVTQMLTERKRRLQNIEKTTVSSNTGETVVPNASETVIDVESAVIS